MHGGDRLCFSTLTAKHLHLYTNQRCITRSELQTEEAAPDHLLASFPARIRKRRLSAGGTMSGTDAAPKRKAEAASAAAADGSSNKRVAGASSGSLVHPKRVQPLKPGAPGSGPVIYWMSRDQRMADNWALLHAADVAMRSGAPVAVAFNLVRG
jgi:hypothetical protein